MASSMTLRRAPRSRARVLLTLILAPLLAVSGLFFAPAAHAAAGSAVNGAAWADTNRNGLRDQSEGAKSGITVQLLSSPGGQVVSTTATSANGTYAFADLADGDYVVRVDAPGPFRFPAAAGGDNDFVRTGDPAIGEPERGTSAAFTIAGATQITGLDAGLQPIADLKVTKMDWSDACEGHARTGMPPFDDNDEPGYDSGTGNCRVRVADSVYQRYSVALTGLPTGASVTNVVAEFTISSPDGAKLRLKGPAAGGMPDGCLYAANGAVPTSSSRTNPDGSITVICNLGTMASNAVGIQLVYDFASTTPIPAHAEITMRSYAAGGEAGDSNVVDGPLVEVTGIAKWELRKTVRGFATGPAPSNPRYVVRNGQPGYQMRYMFEMEDMLQGKGAELQWPLSFHDRMPEFPNAVIAGCSAFGFYDGGPYPSGESWSMPGCPTGQTQGPDGWTLKIQKGNPATKGHTLIDVWIPAEDMYRNVDPSWLPGQATPTGVYDLDNLAKDTDTWAISGGQLNYGDGKEPGYDGTGDNLATFAGEAKEPKWDLQKFADGGPVFATNSVDGVLTEGYTQRYRLRVVDTTGTPNLAPFLDDTDNKLTFKDKFFLGDQFAPDAVLTRCYAAGFTVWRSNNTYSADTGIPTCTTGTQPGTGTDMNTGWELTFHPNQWAYDLRYADMFVDIFVPLDKFVVDPCTDLTTDIVFKNMAVQSDGWTAAGVPMNGTGFEPGWDGTAATGNNVVEHRLNFGGQCGSLTGNKVYTDWADGQGASTTWPGRIVGSQVRTQADNARVKVSNFQQCDVFDVSVFSLAAPRATFPQFRTVNTPVVNLDPTKYVIEYAEGPNLVDTQAGAPDVNGRYPIDASSNDDAASGCRGYAGPWNTDPAAFGDGWKDRVNMVRARPIDPATVATGPFDAYLQFELQSRYTYNGGPNAGEVIPSGVRTHNVGGWPSGHTSENWGDGWSTVARDLITVAPGLGVEKTVSPNTYLPGDTVTWNLNAYATHVYNGETMVNVRLIDTIPVGLEFDLQCTRNLLPIGVTVSYDAALRQATFSAGDILLENVQADGGKWMFHQSRPDASRGALRMCTKVSDLAQPGTNYVNRVQVTADNSPEKPSATATILVVGTGKLGIEKHVDKPYVASGEAYEWSLEWGNTSTMIPFNAPDIVDVLPWNGDFATGSLSQRVQYATAFQGTAQLTGALDAPAYLVGGTGEVPGTWYYATANPATIAHDSRVPANADPQAAGGLWKTASEVGDFTKVTAIRFVTEGDLPVKSRVRALVPAVSTSTALDNVYVNRATILSGSFPTDLLYSNEPYVQMPGFTLGDLVWADQDGDGTFTAGVDNPFAGVTVEVLDGRDQVVATRTTDANGRWSVGALPEGTYRARIPAAMFRAGGPLEKYVVQTTDASSGDDSNEGLSNNNTESTDPRASGLTSTPTTLGYRYASGNLAGGTAPLGDDVAHLGAELIADDFTNFTVDLFVTPEPRVDIEKSTNGQDADTGTGPLVPVGDTVTWTYVVTNTGATELHDLTVTDDKVAASSIDCDATGSNVYPGPLAPGGSFECTATGVAAAGQYENLGTVNGFGPSVGGSVPVTDDDPSHYFGAVAGIALTKDAAFADGQTGRAGDTIRYDFTVENTGNVTLTDVVVTDELAGLSAIEYAWPGAVGVLAPGQVMTATARYVLTQVDVDSGEGVRNHAAVTGLPPVGPPPTDEDEKEVETQADSGIQIVKSASRDRSGPTTVGEKISYRFEVTNVGGLTLRDVKIEDLLPGLSAIELTWPDRPGALAPGATLVGVATYTITQADIDRGNVVNTATACGVPAAAVEEICDEATAVVQLPPAPTAGALPGTGGSSDGGVALAGLIMLLVGGVLVYARRRRLPRTGSTRP